MLVAMMMMTMMMMAMIMMAMIMPGGLGHDGDDDKYL